MKSKDDLINDLLAKTISDMESRINSSSTEAVLTSISVFSFGLSKVLAAFEEREPELHAVLDTDIYGSTGYDLAELKCMLVALQKYFISASADG